MYNLKIIDINFNLLAAIDGYQTISTRRKLREVGAIEIHANYMTPGASLLTPGRIAFVDPKHPYILTSCDIEETTSGVKIAARGQELKTILGRRITLPDTVDDATFYGYDRYPIVGAPDAPAETIMKHYVNKHAVNPADTNRKITQLTIATDQGRGLALRWSSRFEDLTKALKGISEYAGIGYTVSIDLENKCFIFEVIPGTDHGSTAEKPVIFSVAFSNVDSTKYAIDKSPLVTVAYAGGAGENEGRLIQAVFAEETVTTGLNRFESWLDCGNVEYLDDLIYEARYKMQDAIETETLTGDIATSGTFSYLTDWDLGDIVAVQSRILSLERNAQITEVEETYENGKRDINVTFGKRQANILDEIRKSEVIR